jgi:hypothetical protein
MISLNIRRWRPEPFGQDPFYIDEVGGSRCCNQATQAVLARSGKSHWPVVANLRLAKDYPSLYGADRTYSAYCLFNLLSIFGMVLVACYMALYG